MKQIKYLFIILFIYTYNIICAQQSNIEWGKITADDFVERPEDSTAPAYILSRYGKFYFDIKLNPVYYEYNRILILKPTAKYG